jgi:hypothetical protein
MKPWRKDDEVAVRSRVADDLDRVVDLASRRGEQPQSFAPGSGDERQTLVAYTPGTSAP